MSLAGFLSAKDGPRADYAGKETAVDYGRPEAEARALLETAAVFDLGWHTAIRATGSERAEFLQGQLSNDVAALAAGRGCPCLLLNAQGRLLAILSVFNAGERFELVTEHARAAEAGAALEGFLVADDVELAIDDGAERIGLGGPGAAAVLAAVGVEAGQPGLSEAVIAGEPCMVLRHSEFREPVYELVMDGGGERAWSGLEEAGAMAVGSSAWELMRVMSGVARAGVDVDGSRPALEGRLEWAVHRDKGCYVGQEVVERTLSRGRLNRRLCLLSVDGQLEPGAVVSGGSDHDLVTSVVAVVGQDVLALAFVPTSLDVPGGRLELVSGSGTNTARVLEWPGRGPGRQAV